MSKHNDYLKEEEKNVRVKKGNDRADFIRRYFNDRFGCGLLDYSGTSKDKNDCIDFGCKSWNAQCKVRDWYDDVCVETQRFYINDNGKVGTNPGRDARCKALIYIVKGKSNNFFAFPLVSQVKRIIEIMSLNFAKSIGAKLIDSICYNGESTKQISVPDHLVKQWWKRARDTSNQVVELFNCDGVVIKFKIDQGTIDGRKEDYGKFIFYISPNHINGSKIPLREGEIYNDPSTWLGKDSKTLLEILKDNKNE